MVAFLQQLMIPFLHTNAINNVFQGIEYQQANVEAPSVNNMDDDGDDDVVLDRTQEESPSDERKSLLCR